jgi:glycosyltransferase involved in cell wall biosynthesis
LTHICIHGDPRSTNLQSWVRSLMRHQDVRVTILALGTHIEAVGPAPVVNLPLPPALGPIRYGLAAPLIRRAVRRIAPDILLGYRIPSYGVLAFLSGFRPVVLVAQSETELWPPALELKRFLLRRILPRADLIQVWAPTMEPSLIEAGARREQILCLPRGIEVDQFAPLRDLAERPFARGGNGEQNPPEPVRLIVTRALHEDYNHWHVFEAMARLRAEGLETVLDVVGDGPLRAQLEQQAERLVPGAVHFHGAVAHDRLPTLLRECDLYVSTPITEGLSASLIEAMGCGVFPIVTDHLGNRYVIDPGCNGFLVGVGDVPALVDAIREAWSRPQLRARAQRENRAFVEREMRSERNLTRMVERYREVIAGRRAEPARDAAFRSP